MMHQFSYTRLSRVAVERQSSRRYVQVAVPTPLDRGASNGLEQYVWNEEKQQVEVKSAPSPG